MAVIPVYLLWMSIQDRSLANFRFSAILKNKIPKSRVQNLKIKNQCRTRFLNSNIQSPKTMHTGLVWDSHLPCDPGMLSQKWVSKNLLKVASRGWRIPWLWTTVDAGRASLSSPQLPIEATSMQSSVTGNPTNQRTLTAENISLMTMKFKKGDGDLKLHELQNKIPLSHWVWQKTWNAGIWPLFLLSLSTED